MPPGGGTVTTEDGRGSFEFHDGAFSGEAHIVIERVPCGSAPQGFQMGDTCFRVRAMVNGQEVSELGADVTICIKYSSADLAAAGGEPTDLRLSYYDEETDEWQVLSTSVDTANGTACATTSHLSDWAVLVRASGGSSTAWWVYLVAGAGGLLVLLLIVFLLLRQRPRDGEATSAVDKGRSLDVE